METKGALQARKKAFETLREKSFFEGISVDVACTDPLVKILDAGREKLSVCFLCFLTFLLLFFFCVELEGLTLLCYVWGGGGTIPIIQILSESFRFFT